MNCCGPEPGSYYADSFGTGYARYLARRYERRVLTPTARRIVDFVASRELAGATILEVGGGVGDLQVELLRRGASHATNLELSPHYEAEAAGLAERHGLAGRVTRLSLDLATQPEAVEPADVVVLHRVVCCYRDHARLLGAAAERARRLLVFSHPPHSLLASVLNAASNGWERLMGRPLRGYVHPVQDMLDVTRRRGLALVAQERGPLWWVEAMERAA